MLGKLSSLLSYWKVLEVYVCKRFPSNKLPVFGMVFTYFAFAYLYSRFRYTLHLSNCSQESNNNWNFNKL